jgi:hypothetical protein
VPSSAHEGKPPCIAKCLSRALACALCILDLAAATDIGAAMLRPEPRQCGRRLPCLQGLNRSAGRLALPCVVKALSPKSAFTKADSRPRFPRCFEVHVEGTGRKLSGYLRQARAYGVGAVFVDPTKAARVGRGLQRPALGAMQRRGQGRVMRKKSTMGLVCPGVPS